MKFYMYSYGHVFIEHNQEAECKVMNKIQLRGPANWLNQNGAPHPLHAPLASLATLPWSKGPL